MMNAGCFSFEVNACPENRKVPAGIQGAPSCVIRATTARITPHILPTGCVEAPQSADMTANGRKQGRNFCENIPCASIAGSREGSHPRRSLTTSSLIAAIQPCSGTKATGNRCAGTVMVSRPARGSDGNWHCKFIIIVLK